MLSVSNIVRVTVSLTPNGALVRSFGILMIAGDSNVINGAERFRSYIDIDGVASDFGTSAPEYKAAALYFGQNPKPLSLMIGRWFSSASPAQNIGGILSSSEQMISNWTAISSGGLDITIDGVVENLSGLNFTGVTNLNGVASVIQAALSGGQTCIWNGSYFAITSGTAGIGNQASGTVTFASNPTALDTLTLNGLTLTFVSSVTGSDQILIGATAIDTAANLQLYLMNSVESQLLPASYATVSNVLTITYKTVGLAGNSYTLAKVSTAITLSASTLLGGTVPSSVSYATAGAGTDISALLKLTASTSQVLVAGFAAETPVQCAAVLANLSPAWYGLDFAATASITDQQHLDVSTFIEAQDVTRLYGTTITNTNVLSAVVTNDLASLMKLAGYNQSMSQYSQNPYAIASLFGRAFSVDFTANNTTITLMFKQEPGVFPEDLDQNEQLTLKSKNCNVFVEYDNSTMLLQYGVVASGQYIDTIQGTDWLQNDIQTEVFNVLFTTPKVPQTDAGVNQLTNAIGNSCTQAVNNGLVAPGIWNGPSFGQLKTGQFLKTGFYIFAQSVDLQSESDRAARKAPPIQVAIKLAGAIQSADILVDVNS